MTTPDTPTQTLDIEGIIRESRWRGLWRLLRGYRALYIGATISVGVAALARAGFYYLLRYATDNVLTRPDAGAWVDQLPWLALGFVALALVQGAFTFLSGRWAAATAEGIVVELRDYLYDHIQRLTFAYHDKMPTGELISRATSDVEAMRRFFAEEAIGFGRVFLLFTVNFVALLTLNVRLAVISVVLLPIVIVISLVFFRRISQRYEAFQQQEARLATTLQENLSGIRVVKAFARQQYEIDKFERDNYEKFVRGRRLLMLHAYYWPTTDLISGAQMILGFGVGALMVIDGTITLGTYLAYLGLLGWIIWPIRNVGRIIVQMSEGLISFGRVVEIMKERREDLESGSAHSADVAGAFVFDHVSFAYEAESAVLHDISFSVASGQTVALIGATGSGKSTLVNLLPRFYDYGGSIRLDGVELRNYSRRFLRRHIGIVQQEPFLFSRTIRDNITYGVDRAVSEADIIAAAEAAAIHDVILSFPNGYDTLVGERGVTLSGGQKQRVTLARTLLKNPRILILDDATSSVDTETEATIREALETLLPHCTTFIIAHRIQTVMRADMIIVLDKGRIAQRGSHAELLEQDGIYRQIFDVQARVEVELQAELASVT